MHAKSGTKRKRSTSPKEDDVGDLSTMMWEAEAAEASDSDGAVSTVFDGSPPAAGDDDDSVANFVSDASAIEDDDDEEDPPPASVTSSDEEEDPHALVLLPGAKSRVLQGSNTLFCGTDFIDSEQKVLGITVHIKYPTRLKELLYLRDLSTQTRAVLTTLQMRLDPVGCAQDLYKQMATGTRMYAGNSLQHVPRWVRKELLGDTCLCVDMESAWSWALENLHRVLGFDMEIPTIKQYNADVAAFREYVAAGLSFDDKGSISTAKLVILYCVHGCKGWLRKLEDTQRRTISRLMKEVNKILSRVYEHPCLKNLAEIVKQREIERGEFDEDGLVAALAALAANPYSKKKKMLPTIMRNEDEHDFPLTKQGAMLAACYQLVESECIAAAYTILSEWGFVPQLMLFDGIIVRVPDTVLAPDVDSFEVALASWPSVCERLGPAVEEMTGWRMKFSPESLVPSHSDIKLIHGHKVFNTLHGAERCVRTIVYELGERRRYKRLGQSLLAPVDNEKYPGFYDFLRHKATRPGSEGKIRDPFKIIGSILDRECRNDYHKKPIGKLLHDFFMAEHDSRFDIVTYPSSTSIFDVRFKDGLVSFSPDVYEPILRPWTDFKNMPAKDYPVHFLAYPDVSFQETMHLYNTERGKGAAGDVEKIAPKFSRWLRFQMDDKDDRRCLRLLMGRSTQPLMDRWNLCWFVIGPEQIGKTLLLFLMKLMIPLSSKLVKPLGGKSSERFLDLRGKFAVVSDEAECLLRKLGWDTVKTLACDGATDNDIKNAQSSATECQDGAGVHLYGVGNSLYDDLPGKTNKIDKAFVDRCAYFQWNKIVPDAVKDTTLQETLAKELGCIFVLCMAEYFECMRDSDMSKRFWGSVASKSLCEMREQSKLEGDYTAQLLANHSNFYHVSTADMCTTYTLSSTFETAVAAYMKERGIPAGGPPRGYLESVKRDPNFRVAKGKFCRVCNALNPTKKNNLCGDHYNRDMLTSKNIIWGLRLEYMPEGRGDGQNETVVTVHDMGADDDEEDEDDELPGIVQPPVGVSGAAQVEEDDRKDDVFEEDMFNADSYFKDKTFAEVQMMDRLFERIMASRERLPRGTSTQAAIDIAVTAIKTELSLPKAHAQDIYKFLEHRYNAYKPSRPVVGGDSYKPL